MIDSDTLIYRFRQFHAADSTKAREPEEIIAESKMWCSSPEAFNDPFDCNPNFVMPDKSIDDQLRQAERMIEGNGWARNHPQAIRLLDIARNGGLNSPEVKVLLPHGMRESIRRSSVCCFTSSWDDPCMWAHYADSHKGYCLAFRLKSEWPAPIVDVDYAGDRPAIDLSVDTPKGSEARLKFAKEMLATKSDHWEPEGEWRVVRWETPAGFMDFPPEALQHVYLGMRSGADERARILKAAAERKPAIPVYLVDVHRQAFSFEVEQIG
ncbi:DUF2971 domain-containing protein [Dokdonella immobilis]|uniref:DUF2971 domain-containing protein n=1 Tax=Dokdonella immobilis TaxID=578942 RepID=A0A1I4W1W1_9GAMM|nr:DUF2971 domain-containing protein [Dokdonella immobilis]SFN07548.1 Protein of unknown function [Dokdonella immobilis]